MVAKLQTQRKGGHISTEEADRLYMEKKAAAKHVTQLEFAHYLMTHGGDPGQEFVAALRANPHEYAGYVESLTDLLTDPGYADDFFGTTGKVLAVRKEHVDDWAESIAEIIISKTPTLQ